MVSSFGRGFDSLQLHYRYAERTLTLVRVLSFASLCESDFVERDSLQLHNSKKRCVVIKHNEFHGLNEFL